MPDEDEGFSKLWVGSLINWYSPYCEPMLSIFEQIYVVLSFSKQAIDFWIFEIDITKQKNTVSYLFVFETLCIFEDVFCPLYYF